MLWNSTMTGNTLSDTTTVPQSTKFWGIWLPVPTLIAIINTLFWTWLILSTVGYSEGAIEKSAKWILERF